MRKIQIVCIIVLISLSAMSCEHRKAIPIIETCDPTAFLDTTRVYFYYYFSEKLFLPLVTTLVYVEFDTSVADEKIDSLFEAYDLTPAIIFKPTAKYFVMFTPEGQRAEGFFTFYGEKTNCGFGNQSIVSHAYPFGEPHLEAEGRMSYLGEGFFQFCGKSSAMRRCG